MSDTYGYDPDTPDDSGDDTPAAGAVSAPTPAMPPGGLSALLAKHPEARALSDSYDAATNYLKAQRAELSGKEKLNAFLTGFAQPTRFGGNLGSAIANGVANIQKESDTVQKTNAARQALVAKYLAAQGPGVVAGIKTLSGLDATGKPKSSIQITPSLYPGAVPKAYIKTLDANGNPTVQEVPIGTPGATTTPAGQSAPLVAPNTPIQFLTGKQLQDKYGITTGPSGTLDPATTYKYHAAGAEAGNVEDVSTDPLAQYGGATGTALLNMLNPADRAQVQQIAEGAVAPPTAGTRSKAAQRILALAGAAFPGVDFAKNYKTTQDYAPNGTSGKVIVSLGQSIGHAARLADSVDALGNVDLSGVPVVGGMLTGAVNSAKNAATQNTNPAVKQFEINRDAFVKEMDKVFSGANGTSVAAYNQWKKDLNNADSPDVIKSVIQRGVELLGDRMQNQVEPYNQVVGKNRSFLSWLPKPEQAAFIRLNPNYQFTDDDKAYLAQQELAKRQRTQSAPNVPSVPVVPKAPSSVSGGAAVPPAVLQQYRAVPFANKAAARQRLQAAGYDISGLN